MTPAPLRYSELSAADIAVLGIESALELTYPHIAKQQGERRASVILAGWTAWRSKSSAKPVLAQGLGIPTNTVEPQVMDSGSSQDHEQSTCIALEEANHER